MLVVEDDYYQAEDTRRLLAAAGASVIGPFARLGDAIASLERQKPDCAVIDLNLGNGPGFEFARALKQRGVAIVILSGYSESSIPDDLRGVARLEKPASGDAMLKAVGAALAG